MPLLSTAGSVRSQEEGTHWVRSLTRSEDPAATTAFKAKMETEEAKQFTANDHRSLSSRTPGSKSDVDFGNFDAGDKKRHPWKLLGLASVTTSSGGSAYGANSMPQR